jgi:Icc-related predicted phosphoesterase
MPARLRVLLTVGEIRGEVDQLDRLLELLPEIGAEAIVVVGDLAAPWSGADVYRSIFRALGESDLPTFWVPGATDAPIRDYLRESSNMEIVYPNLRGVHGAVALSPDQTLFAGLGGEISDDPDTIRGEEALIRYPGGEAEYRLKMIREFDEHQKVLLFATAPAHKGLGEPGSEVLAELIKTYRPRAVVAGGAPAGHELLGKTLVVRPGRLERGEYAVVDLSDLSVEAGSLQAQATA